MSVLPAFIGTHMHSVDDIPQVCLVDNGIDDLAKYVGFIEPTWLINPHVKRQNQLPPKMLFTKAFLDALPTFLVGGKINGRVGNLHWYQTIQLPNRFVHCITEDKHYVWMLRPDNKASCANGCHILGVWLD